MKFDLRFPTTSLEDKFYKFLAKLPRKIQENILTEIAKLADNPYPYGQKNFLKLKPPLEVYRFVAQYRIRIGDFRVLYDVDTDRKIVWVLTIRRRNEQTYR